MLKNVNNNAIPGTNYLQWNSQYLSKQLSNFFNSHSKALSTASTRKGKLFALPFKRIRVESEFQLMRLICYIHRNPIHHGYSEDYQTWDYCSYCYQVSSMCDLTNFSLVKDLFGGEDMFIKIHQNYKAEYLDSKYYLE